MKQLVLHKIHIGSDVGKELLVVLTEIVQAGFAVDSMAETVFGAAAIAGEEPLADLALTGQAVTLVTSELQLSLAIHHRGDGVAVDIAQQVFRENEMVARIDVAVVLYHPRMTTGGTHGAEAGWLTGPAGKSGVEQLHEHLSHVVAHPLVENGAAEMGILEGRKTLPRETLQTLPLPLPVREGREYFFRRVPVRKVIAPLPCREGLGESLYNRRELNILAAVLLIEMIDIERMVGVVVVHHAHCVPLHAVLLQQAYAAHHLMKGRLASASTAIGIVKLLRPVDGDADEPVVLTKKLAPLVGEQRAVGLQAVVDDVASVGIGLLQLQHTLVETQRTHQRLATVPSEEHLRLRLGLNILTNIGLKGTVVHQHC